MERTAFVTVGTTSFDLLVEVVTSQQLMKQLASLGYTTLLIQIGRGLYEPTSIEGLGIQLDYYRYKDSIASDIKNASVIISHAGSGSVLESLGAAKPLIVVVNECLMGNHQMELAYQLFLDGHLLYATCSNIGEVLKKFDSSQLKPFPSGDTNMFASFLDKAMGMSR